MKKNHFLASPLSEEPGKYTITGIYQPKHWFRNERPVWEGKKLVSNTIDIEIAVSKTAINKEMAIEIAKEYAAAGLGRDLKIYQEPTSIFNKENNTWDVSFKMETVPPGGWFDIIIDVKTGSVLQYSPGE